MSDDLDPKLVDHLVAITRGAANAVPFVGGLLGELITAIIPSQREDRIVKFIRELHRLVSYFPEAIAASILKSPEKIDLIEAGGLLAVRATTEQRIQYIVEAVVKGLTSEGTEIIRRKRLVQLLGEVDDDEISILIAHALFDAGHYEKSHERLESLRPVAPDPLIEPAAPLEAYYDNAELYTLGEENLISLNLLVRKPQLDRDGQIPEFDPNSGKMRGQVRISRLGLMFITSIGVDLETC